MPQEDYDKLKQAQKKLNEHAIAVLSTRFTPDQAALLVDYFVLRPGAGQPPPPPGPPNP